MQQFAYTTGKNATDRVLIIDERAQVVLHDLCSGACPTSVCPTSVPDFQGVSDAAHETRRAPTTLQREAQRLVGAGILQDRNVGRARLLRANLSDRAAAPLTRLLEVTFGPETVIGEEFDLTNAEQVLIYGSWADRYHGTPGPPPNDVDVLVVGNLDRADVYDAADRAQSRLGMQVNPVIRTSAEWAGDVDPAGSPDQGFTNGRRHSEEGSVMSRWPRGEAQPSGPGETTTKDEARNAIQDAEGLLLSAQQLLPTLSIF